MSKKQIPLSKLILKNSCKKKLILVEIKYLFIFNVIINFKFIYKLN